MIHFKLYYIYQNAQITGCFAGLNDIKTEITKETHFSFLDCLWESFYKQKCTELIYPRHIGNKQKQIRMDKTNGKRNKWAEVAVKNEHITKAKLSGNWTENTRLLEPQQRSLTNLRILCKSHLLWWSWCDCKGFSNFWK